MRAVALAAFVQLHLRVRQRIPALHAVGGDVQAPVGRIRGIEPADELVAGP